MPSEGKIKFLKSSFAGIFRSPSPSFHSPLIPKALLKRLTEGERRSSSIFLWSQEVIRKSNRVRGCCFGRWMNQNYFIDSPKISRRSLTSKGGAIIWGRD